MAFVYPGVPLDWQSPDKSPLPPESALYSWLLYPHSLTARLKQFNSAIQLSVHCEAWQNPRPDECAALNISLAETSFIREVQLSVDTKPWVFARTVIPVLALQEEWAILQNLGQTALGDVLFQQKNIERSGFEMAAFDNDPFSQRREMTWARRSVIKAGGKQLLIIEVFLTDFVEALQTARLFGVEQTHRECQS